jgi:hypothetical protein
VPNHAFEKAAVMLASLTLVAAPSKKTADLPAGIEVMPRSATAVAKAFELSSTFQPLMLAAALPMLVISNQSAL